MRHLRLDGTVARAYLQFLACAAGSGQNAEAFVFATRLTRLTRALGLSQPGARDPASRRSRARLVERHAHRRRAAEFKDKHGRRGMARGAVIVILSDGWERGDPQVVGREMERLARLAHRIVWVNPGSAPMPSRCSPAGWWPRYRTAMPS